MTKDLNIVNTNQLMINQHAPRFTAEAYHEEQFKRISLADYATHQKWVVLFFYPADFTFVCPTELESLADSYDKLKELNTEILAISTDTAFVHKAWHDTSPAVSKIKFPMIADTNRNISKTYGTYIEEEGLSTRATFIIDPDGKIKALEMHDNGIGRSTSELIRKIKAAQFTRKYGDQVCPANWEPGEKTLTPGMNLVGKI